MKKPILLIGANGQVGQELYRRFGQMGDVIAVARPEIDLTEPDTIKNAITKYNPGVIINAAAYTAVDRAETEVELAHQVNGVAPGIIGEIAEGMGAFLIHISTDYVFDGTNHRPYLPSDGTNPLSVYGKTKLAGEQAIQSVCRQYVILRTAWVYGNYGKSNFVKTMLRLGKEREEIRVVADQIGSPTWAHDIANAIAEIIPHLQSEISGIYHYTNSGVASWYDFAVAIFREAKQLGYDLQIQRVVPITTAEYPTPAHRPGFSVLDCRKLQDLLGNYPPHWQEQLKQMLSEVKQ
ncbi:dTDP-4-dehydrorhamnose reductase [Calothrix sp. NIES-3974]|uniref:dTDP-4-dehydrorhamnose reductase n=1 Tax=Calothrix sp. NIES-3974 TaxID=2005462 RepID=UPI000B5F6AE1|nr:dTDP-4-dehydrorhamnose reductase [Calothrix sp. NIES-3974]BAZ04121.1 dTDP-4-dehydrorhamnose reductase [Calothrix sp. NIES-3974]